VSSEALKVVLFMARGNNINKNVVIKNNAVFIFFSPWLSKR